jgi:hypothetical protein
MNTEHRYSLASNKVKKLDCPYCGAKKHWQRYIDIETGEVLPEQHGRCDNADKCGKWVTPKDTGYAKAIWEQEQKVTGVTKVTVPKQKYFRTQPKPQPTPEPVFFDFETFLQTLERERYEKNTFIQNLFYRVQFPFEADEVTKVIQLYRLGTVANGYRAGANTFPFIDIKGNVRAVQVKQFDEQNHTTGTDFLHSIIEKHHTRNNKPLPEWLEAYTKQDKRISCLFGEHLLSKYRSNPVALVEAPKTAVYCWLYFNKSKFPIYNNCIWLAVGAKGYLNFDVAKILKGRFVYVLPDLSKDGSTFKEWETKVKEYESRLPGTRFIMDDILERYGTPEQREQGADIADVLNFDWRTIRAEPEPPQPEPEKVTKVTKVTHQQNIIFSHVEPLPRVEVFKTERIEQPQNWSNDIAELENYFASIELPTQPVKLNRCSTITDCSLFIESHFATVKTNNGKRTFLPYLNRLQELKQVLTKILLK